MMTEITLCDALSLANGAKKAIAEGYDVPMMMLAAARLADELDNIKASAEAAKEELRKAREQEPIAEIHFPPNNLPLEVFWYGVNPNYAVRIGVYAAPKPAAIIHAAQMAERINELESEIIRMKGLSSVYTRIEELEGVIRKEAEYCYGYHAKLSETDPERAARHKARGDRLMTAIQG